MRRSLILALIVACTAAYGMTAKEVAKFTKENKALVARDLKDPSSAQFRGLFISESDPTGDKGLKARILCGQVNGKNTFGAYVGFKRFYAVEAGFAQIEGDGDTAFALMWEQSCSRKLADVKQ